MAERCRKGKAGSLTMVLSHLLDFVPPPLMQWPFGHLAICLAKFHLCLQGYLCGWRFGKLFVHHSHRSRRDGMNDSESSGEIVKELTNQPPNRKLRIPKRKKKVLDRLVTCDWWQWSAFLVKVVSVWIGMMTDEMNTSQKSKNQETAIYSFLDSNPFG